MSQLLICPKCGSTTKNMIRHFMGQHKECCVHNKQDILNLFPEYIGSFHIDSRQPGNYECPICKKSFQYQNGVQCHIRNHHPEKYEQYKSKDKRKCASLKCPICGNLYSDIKQHVNIKHNLNWNEFCKKFNWDPKLTKNITEEYRENLSINKKKFYRETERGKELKKIQSQKWKDNNPVFDKSLLEKSIHNRALHNNIPEWTGRGIVIHYKDKRFRSYNEFCFYILCKDQNIDVEYEPTKYSIKYFNKEKQFLSTYLPDFYIKNIGLIELKTNNGDKNLSIQKYSKYEEAPVIYKNLGIPYYICTIKEAKTLVGIPDIPPYKIKERIKQEVLDNLDNIHIWCYNDSVTIQNIFEENFNEDNKNLTLFWR